MHQRIDSEKWWEWGLQQRQVAMPIGCLVAPPLHIAKVHAYSHPSAGQVRINVVWK